MIDYEQIQQLVEDEIIRPLGEEIQIKLIEPSPAQYTVGSPQDGPAATPVEHTPFVVVVPITKGSRRPDGSLALGDVQITLSGALAKDPAVGWLAVINNITHRVVKVKVIRPGVTTVAYIIEAAR